MGNEAYEYTHGGGIYDEAGRPLGGLLDFSASVNPLGMPKKALGAAKRSLGQSGM